MPSRRLQPDSPQVRSSFPLGRIRGENLLLPSPFTLPFFLLVLNVEVDCPPDKHCQHSQHHNICSHHYFLLSSLLSFRKYKPNKTKPITTKTGMIKSYHPHCSVRLNHVASSTAVIIYLAISNAKSPNFSFLLVFMLQI